MHRLEPEARALFQLARVKPLVSRLYDPEVTARIIAHCAGSEVAL
jgi:hypothetical protein